jgi:hypothetical protein
MEDNMTDLEIALEALMKLREQFIDWETIEKAIEEGKNNEAEDAWIHEQECKIKNYYSA